LKLYRPPEELLAEVDRILAAKPGHLSPLEAVAEVLCQGRRYTWVGVYLAVGANFTQQLAGVAPHPHPSQMARPETRSKILISIRLAGRELGVLDAESDRDNAFGAEDRVLLENVAQRLGLFLTGPGKYLARKARQAV
jgi:putative methionine-R-sulfoxide reductase with GAF domain